MEAGAHDLYSPVVDKDNQQSEETLSFVRYYAVKPSAKETKNATMRHLVWEIVPVSGKQRCRQPSYGVVTVDSITQRACVCPHFALWKQGPSQDFLLNDMLNLWPDLRRIPHDAQQQPGQQQQQRPLKRLCKRPVP
ncbi:TPA: hypothetical protein ACH3X1_001174 [Trebouxia sp. C0004]